MQLTLRTPDVAELTSTLPVLSQWQRADLPVQVHPGDLGWNWQFSAATTAAGTRIWTGHDGPVAMGMVDDGVLRLAIAPQYAHDEAVAEHIAADLDDPARGVLPDADASAEIRSGEALRARLRTLGWIDDMPWTPCTLRLDAPVADPGLRVTKVDPHDTADVDAWIAAHRAAWPRSTFDTDRWARLSGGPLFPAARCLIGWDATGHAVAATIVWSAGVGRPGLIEPLGVDHRHRGRGHGRAITLAAARELRSLGADSVRVATPSDNVAAVAAYRSAGFTVHADDRDLRRPRA